MTKMNTFNFLRMKKSSSVEMLEIKRSSVFCSPTKNQFNQLRHKRKTRSGG